MNSDNKNSPRARGVPQPLNQQAGRAPQAKSVTQLKTAVPSQGVRQPAAPPAYRPQPPRGVAQAKPIVFAPGAVAALPSDTIQRNIAPGEAAQHDWNAKSVPQRVKRWAATAATMVRQQYEITLANMAANPGNTGDGALNYMHNWFHKRFGGQYCLLYLWKQRRDGQGQYLAVQGIGRKNGNGNDYALDG